VYSPAPTAAEIAAGFVWLRRAGRPDPSRFSTGAGFGVTSFTDTETIAFPWRQLRGWRHYWGDDVILAERVKGIIVAPAAEWQTIEREPGDPRFLFTNYVAILAAIPAVCGLIGGILLGLPILAALAIAVFRYVMSFVSVYVMAFIVDQVAPTFAGRSDFESALKLVTYAATPIWLAGIFRLVPGLSFLSILGLYALYVLYTGVTPMMRTPADRALVFTVVVVLCMIVVAIVFGIVLSLLIGFQAIV
jgi:hypothetical protein